MARSNLRGKADRGGYTLVDVHGDSIIFSEKRPHLELQPPWHVITPGDRARARGEPPLPAPDFSVNALPGSPREIWSYACTATVTTAPALAGDLVIVGDVLGCVRALDIHSGRLRWEYLAGGAVHSTPAVSDERVVFGSSGGRVDCLDARDGHRLWEFAARGPVLGAPAIVGGSVYIGASDSTLRAIDLATGTLRWEFPDLRGFVESRPLVSDGRVIFGAWDGCLYALDASSGRLLWKWSNGSADRGLSPAACWPVAAAGKIFIVAPDRFMTALDGATGRKVWRSKRFQVREAIGVSSDGKTVFARTMRDTVVALRTDADSLAVEWLTDAGFGYDIAPCMLVEDRGEVIFGTKNGLVIALGRNDGRVLWERKIGVTVVATPVPTKWGILVSDLDGRVVILEKHEK
jgi:outer membrane protein assembly factor BamB